MLSARVCARVWLVAATLACTPRGSAPAAPETPQDSSPWASYASLASAGGERCVTSRPTELGATLELRGEPSDVRVAAGRRGALVVWMQSHPTRAIGRLIAMRALDRQGRPVGVVQTVQPPIAAVLRDVVADDDGFYVLVQAPDQPRANHVVAVWPDGAAVGEFVEIPGTGGLAPVSHGPARGTTAAVLYGPAIGSRDSVWVTLSRAQSGAAAARPQPLPLWRGLGNADHARTWVDGDARHALLLASGPQLELVADGAVRQVAGLPGDPAIGLDARWRGEDIDLVWGVPGGAGPQIRRALLRASGELVVDPPGLPAFDHAVALAWSFPPLVATRRSFAGLELVGDSVAVVAQDPEHTGDLQGTGWAWTGESFVIGYPARTGGGITTRVLRVTCPRQ
jgi:hypothetical protein